MYIKDIYLFIYLFIYLVFNSSSTCQHPPDIITGAAVFSVNLFLYF